MSNNPLTRYSVVPSEALDGVLNGRCQPSRGALRNRSATITMALLRYAETCRRHLPHFTAGEWLAIFAGLRDKSTWDDPSLVPAYVATSTRDLVRFHDGAARWRLADAEGFLDRLDRLAYAEALAVLDAAERYWLAPSLARAGEWHDVAVRFVGAECVLPDPGYNRV